MPRALVYIAAAVLVLHGLVHLLGVAAYWRLAQVQNLPYRTTVLAGRLDLGAAGIRVFGGLFLVACVGFAVAAYGLVTAAPWWRPILFGTTAVSLVITALDWQVAYAGAIINLVLLGAVFVGPLLRR